MVTDHFEIFYHHRKTCHFEDVDADCFCFHVQKLFYHNEHAYIDYLLCPEWSYFIWVSQIW